MNDVLDDLVRQVTEILDDNLIGAYLQGSFAVGDADIDSDCDFLVVTNRALSSDQEVKLRQLHDEIPTPPRPLNPPSGRLLPTSR